VYASSSIAKTDPEGFQLRVMQMSSISATKEATVEISSRAKCVMQFNGLEQVDVIQSKQGVSLAPAMVLDTGEIVFEIRRRSPPGGKGKGP
jgi:hypothetical protein